MSTRLQVFAKEPLPGQVKRRLSPPLTPDEAAEVYRQLLAFALEVAACARDRRVVDAVECWASPEAGSPFFAGIAARFDLALRQQTGSDLGRRMRNALHSALAKGDRALLVGSDCPELSVDVIADAVAALDSVDAVFVPSVDGGYVLVGLARPIECFEGVAWSTPSVMRQTRERLREQGATWRELPALSDVDTIDDLRRWTARAQETSGGFAAPLPPSIAIATGIRPSPDDSPESP